MDSEHISGKVGQHNSLMKDLNCRIRTPGFYQYIMEMLWIRGLGQNSWWYLKHGNAMVGYDHFWASRCTQTAVLQEIHEKLKWKRPKFEQSNYPVGIWRCLISWFSGGYVSSMSREYTYIISLIWVPVDVNWLERNTLTWSHFCQIRRDHLSLTVRH